MLRRIFPEDVKKIKELASKGMTQKAIAKKMNLTRDQVNWLGRKKAKERLFKSPEPKPPLPPCQALIDRYLLEIGSKSISTRKMYIAVTRKLDKFCIENKLSLKDINREHIVDFVSTFKGKNYRNFAITIFKAWFPWLQRTGRISTNPAETIMCKHQRSQRQPVILSTDEIALILKAAKSPRDRLLIQVLAYTGLRLHEALAIKISNIYLEDKIIKIEKAKGDRVFVKPIPGILVTAIRDHIARQGLGGLYLFTGQFIEDQYSRQSTMRNLSRIYKEAIPDKHITSHMFRHTYASIAARNVDASISGKKAFIQSMGWTNDKMFDVYIHLGEDQIEIKKMITRMEKEWEPLKEVSQYVSA